MNNKEILFIHKYQPLYFNDFETDNSVIDILKTLMLINNLNILIVGGNASGKTSLLNALIREYYSGFISKEYEENVLYINSVKEQGINYYRTDVKTFCQTCSNIKIKKKLLFLMTLTLLMNKVNKFFVIASINIAIMFISYHLAPMFKK